MRRLIRLLSIIASLCLISVMVIASPGYSGGRTGPVIFVNQVAFDLNGPKMAVIRVDEKITGALSFSVVNLSTPK